jgi:hypothetical protein
MSGACDRWGMRDRFTEERIDELERDLLGMSLTSTYSIAQYQSVIDGNFWTRTRSRWRRTTRRWRSPARSTAVKEMDRQERQRDGLRRPRLRPNHYDCTIFSHLYGEFKPS